MEPILFWIIVGIVAGWSAKKVLPGEGPVDVPGNLMIGVMGALVGGWLFQLILGHIYGGWLGSTLAAFGSAVALLFIVRAFTSKRTAL